jgi:hypothetical protein
LGGRPRRYFGPKTTAGISFGGRPRRFFSPNSTAVFSFGGRPRRFFTVPSGVSPSWGSTDFGSDPAAGTSKGGMLGSESLVWLARGAFFAFTVFFAGASTFIFCRFAAGLFAGLSGVDSLASSEVVAVLSAEVASAFRFRRFAAGGLAGLSPDLLWFLILFGAGFSLYTPSFSWNFLPDHHHILSASTTLSHC